MVAGVVLDAGVRAVDNVITEQFLKTLSQLVGVTLGSVTGALARRRFHLCDLDRWERELRAAADLIKKRKGS